MGGGSLAPHSTLQPLQAPQHAPRAGPVLPPLPISAETLSYRHPYEGTTAEPVHQQHKDKRKSPGTARNPQTERARVYLYIAEDLQSGTLAHAHVRTRHHSLL